MRSHRSHSPLCSKQKVQKGAKSDESRWIGRAGPIMYCMHEEMHECDLVIMNEQLKQLFMHMSGRREGKGCRLLEIAWRRVSRVWIGRR